MDRMYHCAAMKHVNLCEESPHEAALQNVAYTEAVALTCIEHNVPMVFASTDKACMSQGVYGATKLIAERIVLKYGGSVVRLVNLIGSSGSVFQVWKQQIKEGKPITITDPEMTRYFMPVHTATQFMAEHSMPGKVVIPYCQSVKMGSVANAMGCNNVSVIGFRPGEVCHQWLVSPGEVAQNSLHKIILSQGERWGKGLSSESGPFWNMSELLSEVNKS
jgi:FlaA1/EpsC-like NDP-sugar epimerase